MPTRYEFKIENTLLPFVPIFASSSLLLQVLSSVLFAPDDNNNNKPTRPKLQSDITPNLAHAGKAV